MTRQETALSGMWYTCMGLAITLVSAITINMDLIAPNVGLGPLIVQGVIMLIGCIMVRVGLTMVSTVWPR